MSGDPVPKNLTPSVDEFLGFYNVPGDSMSGYSVLRTRRRLFELDFQERCDVESAAAKLFGSFMSAPTPAAESGFNPIHDPPFFVRNTEGDRTLCVDVIVELLTAPLLQGIRDDLLRRFPQWRVMVIGEDPANAIAIYPSAIRFAGCPPTADITEELARLAAKEHELRESLMRPKRAYYRQVNALLRGAADSFSRSPFCVAGVLDNYLRDRQSLAICIVVNGPDDDAVDLEVLPEFGDQYLSRASALGVDSSGTIVCHYPIEGNAPYCLTTWLCPADYRGPIWITETKCGTRHVLELSSEMIIRTVPTMQ